jgi:hypothetical protein
MQRNQMMGLAAFVALLVLAAISERFILSSLTGGQFGSFHGMFDALPGKWKVIAIGMMPITLIAGAVGFLYFKMVRARSWIGVPGKIVSAKSVQRKVERSLSSSNDQDSEMRNFAVVTYAYEAGGRKLTGSRLSIGADLGNVEVAEKLAKYKTGTLVTVYYDPRKPENAVIERDLPAGVFGFGVKLVAGLIALLFAVVFGADLVRQIVRGQLPEPQNALIVTALALFSAVIALFGVALKRQAAAADGWKETKGRVVSSETERFVAGSDRISAPTRHLLRQRVIYAYKVAGVDYSSDRVAFGARTASSIAGLEQAIVKRYPLGAGVTVYYDPANPSQAILERGVRKLWLVWASAALFAVIAVAISGVL